MSGHASKVERCGRETCGKCGARRIVSTIWQDPGDCEHEWGAEKPGLQRDRQHLDEAVGNRGGGAKHSEKPQSLPGKGSYCQRCGAWRGALGLEPAPGQFVANIVEVMRGVWRVLRDDGTAWINLGDSYSSQGGGKKPGQYHHNTGQGQNRQDAGQPARSGIEGLKPGDLIGIPWLVAFALQADGWTLRKDVIWHKCLSAGATLYVRSQKGDMPMTLKDAVRLAPQTVKLWNGTVWTQVLNWHRVTDPPSALEIELRNGERIGCTGDHRWPTDRGLQRTDELQLGDVVWRCHLPPPEAPNTPAALNDEEIGWLVGFYLAEGSRSGAFLQFSMHKNEEHFADRLRITAESLDGSAPTFIYGNKRATQMHGPTIVGVIDTYVAGSGSAGKHLTTRAWRRNNAFLGAVLQGYLDGDGHQRQDTDQWRIGFCDNTALARDLRTLCARLGLSLRLKRCNHKCNGKTHPGWRGSISRHDHRRATDGEVVAIRFSRANIFYDVEVADEPHLFALASGTLTHNSNAMPSSVEDRPGDSHEYLFMLTKTGQPQFWTHRDGLPGTRQRPAPDYRYRNVQSAEETTTEPPDWKAKVTCPGCAGTGVALVDTSFVTFGQSVFQEQEQPCEVCGGRGGEVRLWQRVNLWQGRKNYYDRFAVMEPLTSGPSDIRKMVEQLPRIGGKHKVLDDPMSAASAATQIGQKRAVGDPTAGRNRRSVWNIPTTPYRGAHFAVFPEALVEPPLLASSSPYACAACGAPYWRQVEQQKQPRGDCMGRKEVGEHDHGQAGSAYMETVAVNTIGFVPTCGCDQSAGPGRCLVLDPFAGSGTTAATAIKHGRDAVICEMNPEYAKLAEQRIADAIRDSAQLTMFGEECQP